MAAVVAAGVVVVAAAGWWLVGGPSGVKEELAKRKVREVAVGTWACTLTWDGDVEWKRKVGITGDGRIGFDSREPTTLVEGGTWTLHGLQATVVLPMSFQGMPMTARLIYTGDADPPTRVVVLDKLTGGTGRFTVDLDGDRLTASQRSTGRDGTEHVKRIRCTKTSSDEPEVVHR